MKFNDQLHKDLFDLLILRFQGWGVGYIKDEAFLFDLLSQSKNCVWINDLFPLENHPEEFEGWRISKDHDDNKIGFLVCNKSSGQFNKKIKFHFVEDER